MNTEKLDRKKRYYQKHRSKILNELRNKRRPQSTKVQDRFRSEKLKQCVCLFYNSLHSLLGRHIQKLLVGLLLLACTAYLVTESARTFATIEGSGAVVKALLCEAVLVGISMLAVPTRRMQFMRLAVLIGVIVLSLLSTLGAPLISYRQAQQQVR